MRWLRLTQMIMMLFISKHSTGRRIGVQTAADLLNLTKIEEEYLTKELNSLRGTVQPAASNMQYMEYRWNKILEEVAEFHVLECRESSYEGAFTFFSLQHNKFYGVIASKTKEGIISYLRDGKATYDFQQASCPDDNSLCIRYWEAVVSDATNCYCKKGRDETLECYLYACVLEIAGKQYRKGEKPYQEGERCSNCNEEMRFTKCLEGVCATESQCSLRPNIFCGELSIEVEEAVEEYVGPAPLTSQAPLMQREIARTMIFLLHCICLSPEVLGLVINWII